MITKASKEFLCGNAKINVSCIDKPKLLYNLNALLYFAKNDLYFGDDISKNQDFKSWYKHFHGLVNNKGNFTNNKCNDVADLFKYRPKIYMNDPQEQIEMSMSDYIRNEMAPYVYEDLDLDTVGKAIQNTKARETILTTIWTLQYICKISSRKETVEIFNEPSDHIFALNEAVRILDKPNEKVRKNKRYYSRLASMIEDTYRRIKQATSKTDITDMKSEVYRKAEYSYLEKHNGKKL